MRIDVFTLFPQMFNGPMTESILKRAQAHGLLEVLLHDIRDYATDKHHVTDEPPYGGGGGMIMKVEPIVAAVESQIGLVDPRLAPAEQPIPVILTTPQGEQFSHAWAKRLASYPRIAFICGRYEGVDDRVKQLVVTHEFSIGDYVLTGGELPTMVMIDAIARHLPGVLGEAGAADDDSHAAGLLEYPQYTRPPIFRDHAIPAVMVSGNHAEIERWRRREALRLTWERRPEMLLQAMLTEAEKRALGEIALEWIAEQRDTAPSSVELHAGPAAEL